jgi:uncharacterized repeat protein (TIGR03803 family)
MTHLWTIISKAFKMKKIILLVICIFQFAIVSAQYTKLYDLSTLIADGQDPVGSLLSMGNYLYGMTPKGGPLDNGTIFKIKSDGTGYALLYNFGTATNGRLPYGSLISDGTSLYGMASAGGTYGVGTIFKLNFDGTGFTKLLDFNPNTTLTGYSPNDSLISDGTYLYGMTLLGGTNGRGGIFKIKLDGTGFAKLFNFDAFNPSWGNTTGDYPKGSLFSDETFLYGMTNNGGNLNKGTIFKIKLDGTGFTTLLHFNGSNGSNPVGSFISDGTYLYGMTPTGGLAGKGTIFKIKTDGTGYTNLHNFDYLLGQSGIPSNNGSLLFDGTFLYGVNALAGSYSQGTIFKIKPDGTEYTDVYEYLGTNISTPLYGKAPTGSLVSDGTSFYGMALGGNTSFPNRSGIIFKYQLSNLGTNSNVLKNSFSIYPNPSNGIFNIEIDENSIGAKTSVYNLLGQKVKDFKLNSTTTNQTLNKGIYLLETEKYGNKITKKLIVN